MRNIQICDNCDCLCSKYISLLSEYIYRCDIGDTISINSSTKNFQSKQLPNNCKYKVEQIVLNEQTVKTKKDN